MEKKKIILGLALALLWAKEASAIKIYCPTKFTKTGDTWQAPAPNVAGADLPLYTISLLTKGEVTSIANIDPTMTLTSSSSQDKITYTFSCPITVVLGDGAIQTPATASFQTDKLTNCKPTPNDAPPSVTCSTQ